MKKMRWATCDEPKLEGLVQIYEHVYHNGSRRVFVAGYDRIYYHRAEYLGTVSWRTTDHGRIEEASE